jgi:hypothetical protein
MSKCGGVFGVARSIWDHPVFKPQEFPEAFAWTWILSEAKYQDGFYKTHAGQMFLARGELCHSERFMAKKFGWPKSRVNRFLAKLEKNDMLDRTTRRKVGPASDQLRTSNRGNDRTTYQVLSVRNYNAFQLVGLPDRTTSPEPIGPASDQLRTKLKEIRNNTLKGEPPSAAQEASQRLWSEGLETLSLLANPSLGETQARRLIGRWISKKGLAASPENALRAILDAAIAGTPQPVPYIEAILKNAAGGVRRDGDDWLIPHGTEEYRAHRQQLAIANSPEIYRWPDTPGHVARAKSRWPMRVVSAA